MLKRLVPIYALTLATAGCGNVSTADLPKPVICEPDDKYSMHDPADYLRKDAIDRYSAIYNGNKDEDIRPMLENRRVIQIEADKFTVGEAPCALPQFSLPVNNYQIKKGAKEFDAILKASPRAPGEARVHGVLVVINFNNAAVDNKIPLYDYRLAWDFMNHITQPDMTGENERGFIDVGEEFGKEHKLRASEGDLETIKRAGAVAFYWTQSVAIP